MKPNITTIEKNRAIAWLAVNAGECQHKTRSQVIDDIRKELGIDLSKSTKTMWRISRDIGVTYKPERKKRRYSRDGHSTKYGESQSAYENVVALARVLLSLVHDLGATPHPDLLVLANRSACKSIQEGDDDGQK